MTCAWGEKSHSTRLGHRSVYRNIATAGLAHTNIHWNRRGEVGLDANKALVVTDAAVGARGDRNFSEKLDVDVRGDSTRQNLSAKADTILRSHGSDPDAQGLTLSDSGALQADCNILGRFLSTSSIS